MRRKRQKITSLDYNVDEMSDTEKHELLENLAYLEGAESGDAWQKLLELLYFEGYISDHMAAAIRGEIDYALRKVQDHCTLEPYKYEWMDHTDYSLEWE